MARGRWFNQFTLLASAMGVVVSAACATSDASVTGVNQQGDSLALSAIYDSSYVRTDTTIVAGDTIVRVQWVDTIFAPGDTTIINVIDTIFSPGDTVVINRVDTVIASDTAVWTRTDTVNGPDGPQLVTSIDTVVTVDTVILNVVDTVVTVDTVLVSWGRDTILMVDTVTFEVTDTVVQYDTVLVRDESPEIKLDRGALSLRVGQSVKLKGSLLDGDGNPIAGASISWLSDNPGVARVASDGTVKGISVGVTEVFAVADGASASLRVTVSEESDVVAQIQLSPSSFGLAEGDTRQMSARAVNSDGAPISGATIEWSSSAPGVASVNSTGRVTGVKAGNAKITASHEGVSKSAVVVVTAALSTTDDLIFYDSFESGDLSHTANGLRWGVGKRSRVVSGTATDGSRSLRVAYDANPLGKDGWAEQPLTLPDLTEIYVEFDWLVPDNFRHRYDGGSSNNKLFRAWQTHSGTLSVTWEYTRSAGTDFVSHLRTASGNSDTRMANRELVGGRGKPFISKDGPVVPGKWVTLGFAIKTASGLGRRDGFYRLYVDGVKTAWVEDYELWNRGGLPVTTLTGLYLMGWANSGFTEPTNFHIDNFKVYRRIPDNR